MKEKIINYTLILLIVLALFFFLPFERIPTIEFSDFTLKINHFFGIALLLSAIFVRKMRPVSINKSDIFLFLFLLYGLASIFWASDLTRAIVIWSLWFYVALIYKVISSLKLSGEQREKIIDVILYSTLLVALFGLYQFIADSVGVSQSFTGLRYQYTKEILGFPRIQSVAIEPLYFSNFLLVPFFLSIKRYFDQKKFFSSYFLLTFLILINIFLGVSRGAFIALAITIIALAIYLIIKKDWQKVYKIFISLIFSFVASTMLLFSLNGLGATKTYFNHIVVGDTNTEVSTVGRIEVYKEALNTFKDSPFGTGVASFGVENQGLVDYSDIKSYGAVNNQYLEILVEVGIIGFILFVLFLIYYALELYPNFKRSKNKLYLILLSLGVLAIFIQYNFFSTLYIIYIWVFLGLLKNTKND